MTNQDQLLLIMKEVFGPDEIETEWRFHPVRRWRFDYAVPARKIAVEYQGHGRMGGGSGHIGGHASVMGLTGDAEKFNAAEILGWRVILFTALHFRERDRRRHNLTAPLETLQSLASETA